MQPPLLPEEVLRRVLRVGRFHGMMVLTVAGAFGLLSAAAGDRMGALIGLAIAGAGAVELHGSTLLRGGFAQGIRWLVGSQFLLMVAMLGYCGFRLTHVVLPPVPPHLTEMVETATEQLGMTQEEYLTFAYRLGFQVVACLTIIYQGGMALYYLRRRVAVRQAVGAMERVDGEE